MSTAREEIDAKPADREDGRKSRNAKSVEGWPAPDSEGVPLIERSGF